MDKTNVIPGIFLDYLGCEQPPKGYALVRENDSFISLDFSGEEGKLTIAIHKSTVRRETLDMVREELQSFGLKPFYDIKERRTVDGELYIKRLTPEDQRYLSGN